MTLRDIIWPCRGPAASLDDTYLFALYENAIFDLLRGPAAAQDSDLLAQSWRLFDNDVARRNTIDTRASVLMPASALALALVTGIGFGIMKDVGQLPAPVGWAAMVTYLAALIYLMRTIQMLFVVHGPIARYTPDPTDLRSSAPAGAVSRFHRDLACKILQYTVDNYRINNVALEALSIAQVAFRNGIACIVIGGAVAGILLFIRRTEPIIFDF